jgi:dUTP pyrophosphatase
MIVKSHYVLRLKVPDELRNIYTDAANKHNQNIDSSKYFDAGFDLFSPTEETLFGNSHANLLDQCVSGSMEFLSQYDNAFNAHGEPVCYYMYPRSSTGSKTPLRLANSVGIIDSGYRGNYIAVFDNLHKEVYNIMRLQRLVQICPPNLSFPMKVMIVDCLGETTARGNNGFGSTGL